jgi:hypothetical protein
MQRALPILRYVLLALVVVGIGAFGGWYFYLKYQVSTQNSIDAARNIGGQLPVGSETGSTASNVAQTIPETTPTVTESAQVQSESSPLWHVDKTPIAGFAFIAQKGSASSSSLYFAQRANGNVFKVDPFMRSTARLTNTLKTKTYEALFAQNGGIIGRSLEHGAITTFEGTIATSSTASSDASSSVESLRGFYLPSNVRDIAISGQQNLVYTIDNAKGGVDLMTLAWGAAAKPKILWSSGIHSWNLSTLQDGRTIVIESPADDVVGFAYAVDAKGAASTLARNLPGLSVLPQSGSQALLLSTSARGTVSLFAQKSAAASALIVPLHTVVDKCAWLPLSAQTAPGEHSQNVLAGKSLIAYCAVPTQNPAGAFLNAWYKGQVHTSDDWWKIDLMSGSTTMIYSPASTGASIDVVNPHIDVSGNYIAFQNAADNSLWLLRLTK